MKRLTWPTVALTIALFAIGCQGRPSGAATPDATPASRSPAVKGVREATVAGIFYPADEKELARRVDQLLAAAKAEPLGKLRGLVCPHAGYEYSGTTAAIGYKQLAGRTIRTVVVLAPSHYAAFQGASIPDVEAFRTPLGLIQLSPKAAELRRNKLFDPHPRCDVERPQWWRSAPMKAPVTGGDTPHTWEHSLEVQLPFLQQMLKHFQLVPIVFGSVDPRAVADALAGQLDDQTLVVASSDLSHYHPYDTARDLDKACVEAICKEDTAALATQEACGQGPVLALVHLARQKHWQAKLLDLRNSGDATGDRSAVVGYAAIALYEPDGQAPARPQKADSHTPDERKFLLGLARKTIVAATSKSPVPHLADKDVPERLRASRGCFVTLTERGELRGCIGHIVPQKPLYKAVVDCATSAALEDPRFSPVQTDEVDKVHIEISVLTVPEPLDFRSPDDLLARLRPNRDGVVLSIGGRSATFLPQVWEQLPDKVEFLSHLSQKAGQPAAAWRRPQTKVMTYQVEAFQEEAPGSR